MNGKFLKKGINLILILFLFWGISTLAFGQDKNKNANDDKPLREEVLTVYQSGGEQGLRNFIKKQGDKITNKFIVDFAEAGVDERKEEWLQICEVMAEEKRDEKTLADVYLKMGEYFRLISENKKAFDYLDKALPIYFKSNDAVGQGNVYLFKGMIYLNTGDKTKALEMFAKVRPFFEKTDEFEGLGNTYLYTGKIYWRIGDVTKAVKMYDQALSFFEKAKSLGGQGKVYLYKGAICLYNGDISMTYQMYDKALLFFKQAGELIGLGNVYLGKGDIYSRNGDNLKAIEMYDIAVTFFEKADSPISRGHTYLRKGNIYYHTGANSKALEMYDEALLLYEKSGDISGQGDVYKCKGDIYFRIGDNSKALQMYDKAAPLFEKAGETLSRGIIYEVEGDICLRIGNNSKALEFYKKALPIFKIAGYSGAQGNIYMKRGDIYFRIGDNSQALKMYDKAISFYEKVGQLVGQGNVYIRMGDIYSRIGDNSKAIELFDKALFFFQEDEEPIGQGNVYQRKGHIYLRISDNSKAIDMYNKALSFFKKVKEPVGLGNVYSGKGEIYSRIGDNPKALKMYDKALFFFNKAESPVGQGNVCQCMGQIYSRSGDNLKAMGMYEKALQFFIKSDQLDGQGNVYLSKGDIYLSIGENSKAIKMYDFALSFFEKTGQPDGQGSVYLKKGDIYSKINKYSKATVEYENAILLFRNIASIEGVAYSLNGKAKILEKRGNADEALILLEKAIANLERVRTQTAFSEMKQTFLEKVYEQYEESVLFMLEKKFYDKAFRYTESMRARVFLDQMAEGLRKLEKGLNPGLKEERDRLVGKLSTLSRQMQETGGKDEKRPQELKEEYQRVESEFEDLLIKIRLENPLYASVNYPRPISITDLQKDVLKKDETLLSYFISPEKSYAFIITKNNFNVKPLKVKENEIKGLVDRYLPAIKENNVNDIKRFGSLLYEKLFKPLEKYLDKNNDIIIVPMRELEIIPFEALVVDKNKQNRPVFLLEKYRLTYVQGATLLSILRKHYTTRGNTSKSFIGFGDPVYDYQNFTQNKTEQGSITRSSEEETSIENEIKELHCDRYARAGGIMNRLPQSGEEIQTIARLFDKESLKNIVHLREQATEENAKAAGMKDFDYIHFSCHGLLNDDFQSLVLSQLPLDKSNEDGYFTLNEIMNCDYNAKLVVLSACETGRGKMYKGEGVTGLTRAVMYAGTPAVVASLWKVDDTATKELMIHFYRNLLEKKMDKVEALRQAKLELLNTESYHSPLFWSAFIMYGE